ncbi:MAG TPA: tripartite tricarboxylate transporter substrate binding protein [Ramlibacter sp.]|nr:tripartite tricarboxylate transporter substrate binding protein [Ramlibacter sp.]
MKHHLSSRRRVLVAGTLGLAAAIAPSFAAAADYPSRVITLVVPYPPGGSADIMARLLSVELGNRIKQTVVVKNSGGASGNIGAQMVKNSQPDGYTLMLGNAPVLAINPHLYKEPGFDPIKDFEPITPIAEVPLFLITNPSAPYKTVQQFVDWVKKNQAKANYASGSSGSTTNLAMKLFMKQAGINALEIPYKGSGPALTALVAGQVPIMFELMPSASGFISSGQVNAIAVTTRTRQANYPNIPTIAESGYPGYDVASWFGVLAPAGTPKAIIDYLNKAITATISTPQFQKRLLALGAVPMHGGPEEFKQIIAAEFHKWESVIKDSGMTPQ